MIDAVARRHAQKAISEARKGRVTLGFLGERLDALERLYERLVAEKLEEE